MNIQKEKETGIMGRKRMYAMVLALTVAATALSGCGGKDKDSQKKENTQQGWPGENTEQGADTEYGDSQGSEITGTDTEEPPVQYPAISSDESVIKHGAVVQVGDAAYELYSYSEDAADIYAMAVNKAAEELSGKAQVYSLMIPLSSAITFPDNLRDQISSADQQQAIQKIGNKLDAAVTYVDFYDDLMAHRDEYIYFRTDHHWTARGAYYAYEKFCRAKGIDPEALDSYATKDFDGFLGSFYNDTNKDAKLGANPDVVTAYLPKMSAICHVEDSKGVKYDSAVIYDETKAPAGLKYSAFIAGDNPYTEIVNHELTDGSACIVLKESFGNAFVPFLVDHYQTIYVIDYRYWSGNVGTLAEEKGVTDVIFVNNLSMARSKSLVSKLYRVI
ncbi:MAG: hypothetical protein J1D89_04220 [Agathobacter sp.]|nr:hypothetical protein [Agathobacter sp.]